jgi:hypothetical protein
MIKLFYRCKISLIQGKSKGFEVFILFLQEFEPYENEKNIPCLDIVYHPERRTPRPDGNTPIKG